MIYVIGIIVLYLLGKGTLEAFYKKDSAKVVGMTDVMLTGGIVVIGLAEAAHLGAVVLGRSFSDCIFLFLAGLAALLLSLTVLLFVRIGKHKVHKAKKTLSKGEVILALVWCGMALFQLLLFIDRGYIYLVGDMTVETVNTMLATDTIYQVNPMTGQNYEQGVPMRLKILCLPTLYAILCDVFRYDSMELVWKVIPVFTLLGCYGAFYSLGKKFFPEDTQKRNVFMIAVALLLWVSDFMYGVDGFGLWYSGFQGVSIRMLILLPYTISMVLGAKWKSVCMCVLAEACIVWTTYGVGLCLLTAGVLSFVKSLSAWWGEKCQVAKTDLWERAASEKTEEVDR